MAPCGRLASSRIRLGPSSVKSGIHATDAGVWHAAVPRVVQEPLHNWPGVGRGPATTSALKHCQARRKRLPDTAAPSASSALWSGDISARPKPSRSWTSGPPAAHPVSPPPKHQASAAHGCPLATTMIFRREPRTVPGWPNGQDEGKLSCASLQINGLRDLAGVRFPPPPPTSNLIRPLSCLVIDSRAARADAQDSTNPLPGRPSWSRVVPSDTSERVCSRPEDRRGHKADLRGVAGSSLLPHRLLRVEVEQMLDKHVRMNSLDAVAT
jgi:hypothetical protein